jgi:arsenate reductase-like glutaredoxin family protein
MATAKQVARQELKALLQKDLDNAKKAVSQNKWEFKKLALQQEVLKRKVAEAHQLIKTLEVL